MRLINADKLKADFRTRCSECAINGTKHCKEHCNINNICEVIDLQPTVFDKKAYSQGYTQGTLDCRAAMRSENNGKK